MTTQLPEFSGWYETPFNTGTRLKRIDVLVGNSTDSRFALDQLTGLQVGRSGQIETTLYPRSSGDMVVDTIGNTVTFLIVPVTGDKIVIPGDTTLVLPCSDQNDSIGRTVIIPFWIGDNTTRGLYKYRAMPGQSGIRLDIVQNITSGGAQPGWFSLAKALPDGTADTFASPGASIYTDDISGTDVLTNPAIAGDGSITVTDGSLFIDGDYLAIDYGNGSQETVKISTHTGFGNGLLVPATVGNGHLVGASVITVARKFFLKIVVPLNVASGSPQNWYNISIDAYARATAIT